MVRYKTFDSTGVAPNGRLFAGDLNAIQDAAAGLTDFTQVISLSELKIGETGLNLTRFGALEAQLAGNLRTTKRFRAAEGMYAGTYTTAQRDAIAVGSRPYGLIILNSQTNQYEWNSGSDASPVWSPFSSAPSTQGTLAARPAANAVLSGTFYWATDQVVLYRSNGTTWDRMGIPAGHTGLWFSASAPAGHVLYNGTALPSSTGIYADLATHLGGIATPDMRGRMPVGLGTHVDVDAVGKDEGLAGAIGSKRPRHSHIVTDPQHAHAINPGGTPPGAIKLDGATPPNLLGGASNLSMVTQTELAATGITVGQLVSAPVDSPAFIVFTFIAKL